MYSGSYQKSIADTCSCCGSGYSASSGQSYRISEGHSSSAIIQNQRSLDSGLSSADVTYGKKTYGNASSQDNIPTIVNNQNNNNNRNNDNNMVYTLERMVEAMVPNMSDQYSIGSDRSISELLSYAGHSKADGAYFGGYQQSFSRHYDVSAPFLSDNRPITQFIDGAEQIKDYVTETFRILTGKEFPQNIIVKVTDKETMKAVHESIGGRWNNGILGFAINNMNSSSANKWNDQSASEIFILKGRLDRVMLVIGHELGHVLSERKQNKHDEEAKAFAFEFAWAKAIKEHNIANLSENIIIDLPAENGLHDKAFLFVKNLLKKGISAMDVYLQIIKGNIAVLSNN
jgi:hypothetical protein